MHEVRKNFVFFLFVDYNKILLSFTGRHLFTPSLSWKISGCLLCGETEPESFQHQALTTSGIDGP